MILVGLVSKSFVVLIFELESGCLALEKTRFPYTKCYKKWILQKFDFDVCGVEYLFRNHRNIFCFFVALRTDLAIL